MGNANFNANELHTEEYVLFMRELKKVRERTKDPESARKFLQEVGIFDKNGNLTKEYQWS